MYLSQNQLIRERKFLSRINVEINGHPAADQDIEQFLQAQLMRVGLMSDLLSLPLEQCPYRRAIHSIKTVDISSYAEDWSLLKQSVIEVIQGSGTEFSDFKRRLAGRIHYKWILSSVATLFDSPKDLYQWVTFDERLLVEPPIPLTVSCDEYVESDKALQDSFDPEIVTLLRKELSFMLKDFSLGCRPPEPKFGPGSVSGLTGRIPRLAKAALFEYDETVVDELCEYFGCDRNYLVLGVPTSEANFTNEIVFVPKNARKRRIISKEPLWLTWLQQAIKEPLYEYVSSSKDICSDFRDQSVSRDLALRGSTDGSFGTIDFSAASDSVSVALVKELFQDTYILEPLLLTRSHYAALPDSRVIELKKFAPMGSACCFVTMDLILVACVRVANRLTFGQANVESVVYGDDVILRAEAIDTFVKIATSIGFRPNMDKSYTSTTTAHMFRESCGIECLDGVDITPLRYSRHLIPLTCARSSIDETLCAMIDFANLAFDYGYMCLRNVIFEICKADLTPKYRRIFNSIPRIDQSDWTDDFGIKVIDGTATNYRAKVRWNADLQRVQHAFAKMRSTPNNPHDEFDDILLDLWMFSARLDHDSEWGGTLSGSAGYASKGLRIGWD